MNSRCNNSSKHQMLPARNSIDIEQKASRKYLEDDGIDEDNDEIGYEEDDDEFEDNGELQFDKDDFEDDNEENDFENKNEQQEDEEEEEDGENHKHQKKRKLKSLLAVASSYEFAPRVRTPIMPETGATKKRIFGARNAVADWSEHETFILLDAWGDKFLKHGRKSLWSEEWQEVAKIVSQRSKRTDNQCRNRLDTLKKKYKKEKAKMPQNKRFTSTWIYFKRMDLLMSLPPRQAGVSRGVDSEEHVVTNTKRGNSYHEDNDRKDTVKGCSLRLITDSIIKSCRIYEKIEKRKRLKMLELEEMRMTFRREMELKKMQILERTWTEIMDICQRTVEENNDLSDEDYDTSG